ARGIATRRLHVSRAFHSALIEPALPGLRSSAARLPHHAPGIPIVSKRDGQFMTAAPQSDYWAEHARSPVQFAAGVRTLFDVGISTFVEIGPDVVLSRLGPGCLAVDAATTWVPSLCKGQDDWQAMMLALGRLYVAGAQVDFAHVDERARWPRLDLPTYPFEHQPYWI